MTLRLGDTAPDFQAESTIGPIRFHEWAGDSWTVLFSHPRDFTPVCTTELGYMAGLQEEFAKRNCKIIGLSVDPVDNHGRWAADIEETQGHRVNYPMIGDPELKVAKAWGMLPADLDGRAPPSGSPGYFMQMDDDAWGYSPDRLQLQRRPNREGPGSSTAGIRRDANRRER